MNAKKLFVSIAMLMLGFMAYAQNLTIKGTVLDEAGLPVIGAGIVVDGSNNYGTTVDVDGNFTLNIDPSSHKSFTVVALGYESKTVEITKAATYNVVLGEEASKLDEVVVVAFGTQKKMSVTGSLSYVKSEDLKKSPVSNFQSSLAGRLPGLTITQTSGMPGNEQVNMKMRGVSTYGDSSPLILIDGVPRDDMSSVDANEVESVTVLKDAAATAVFGVRGANGVILITTQRGQVGKANVSIGAEYGVQQLINRGSYKINSWEYAELLNEKNANLGKAPAYTDWQI